VDVACNIAHVYLQPMMGGSRQPQCALYPPKVVFPQLNIQWCSIAFRLSGTTVCYLRGVMLLRPYKHGNRSTYSDQMKLRAIYWSHKHTLIDLSMLLLNGHTALHHQYELLQLQWICSEGLHCDNIYLGWKSKMKIKNGDEKCKWKSKMERYLTVWSKLNFFTGGAA
jgi:hypothetical protein